MGVAGVIYAATVLAAGLGATLDWALNLALPMPPILFGLLLPLAVLYGFTHDAVHRLGWADAPGLVRAAFLVALILAAILASAHGAVLGAEEKVKAVGTAMMVLASWLIVVLAALDRGPPGASEARRDGVHPPDPDKDDQSPVNQG